jgi:hypothetical protein
MQQLQSSPSFRARLCTVAHTLNQGVPKDS